MEFVFVRPDVEISLAKDSGRDDLLRGAEEFANNQGRVFIMDSRSEKDAKRLFALANWLFLA